jgi:hypothetical protein
LKPLAARVAGCFFHENTELAYRLMAAIKAHQHISPHQMHVGKVLANPIEFTVVGVG